MMIRILNFLEMLPVWRVRRRDTTRYLEAAYDQCDFETAGPPLWLSISENPPDIQCETEDVNHAATILVAGDWAKFQRGR